MAVLSMSQQQFSRLDVLLRVQSGRLRVADACALIGLSRRQVFRLLHAVTESTVQWLLHRRMHAQQQMRWSPRGAHLMLKVRTAVVNGTLDRDHAVAERWACRPFRRAA
jgi:hypothetical protein